MDCLFCKIVKKEIPCNKIYENDKILAFLDIGPVNPGHALVLPKEHYENIQETPDELLAELIIAVKKVGNAIMQATNTKAYNLGVNNGKISGQLVPHLHFHIMPRLEDDGLKHWPQGKYAQGEAEELSKNIARFIKD